MRRAALEAWLQLVPLLAQPFATAPRQHPQQHQHQQPEPEPEPEPRQGLAEAAGAGGRGIAEAPSSPGAAAGAQAGGVLGGLVPALSAAVAALEAAPLLPLTSLLAGVAPPGSGAAGGAVHGGDGGGGGGDGAAGGVLAGCRTPGRACQGTPMTAQVRCSGERGGRAGGWASAVVGARHCAAVASPASYRDVAVWWGLCTRDPPWTTSYDTV